jgi:signal transduction histidine kinase
VRWLQSLRLRLLVGAAICVTIALVVSGFALVLLFESNIDLRTRDELTATRNRLVAAIAPSVDPAVLEQTLTDPRYQTPFGGLYWQVQDLASGTTYRSRSLWDTTIVLPRSLVSPAHQVLNGPADQKLSVFGGMVTVETATGPRSYIVAVGRDRTDAEQSIRRFGLEMTLDLLVLGATLVVASWIQVNIGLRPLRSLAIDVETIRAGGANRLVSNYPTEVLPLVREVNELLDARDESLEVSRFRAAELAHSLKTPMAVVSATAERLRAAGDVENAETLATLSAEVTDEIDYHLRLAGIRPRDTTMILRSSLNVAVLRTVSVLRKTRHGEPLHWQLELGKDVQVDVDEHDLLELVGIVLENAAKWASSTVRVSITVQDGSIRADVSDDGPGLTEDQISKLGTRGARPRDDKPGSGFGLAIALQIATTNSGAVLFGRSKMGGLNVTICFPPVDILETDDNFSPSCQHS